MVDRMMSMPEDELRECLCQADPDQQHQLSDLGAQLRRQIEYKPAFKHPMNMILAGPSSSGKTYYLARMLEADLIEPRPESIHLFTGVKDSTGELIQALERLEQEHGIPFYQYGGQIDKADEVLDDFEGRKLIIMDDLMFKVTHNEAIAQLFVNGTHHKNASAILVWQELFPRGKKNIAQTMAYNAHYNVIFPTPRIVNFQIFSNQRVGGEQLMSLFKEMTRDTSKRPLVVDNRNNRAWLGVEPTHIIQLD